MPVKKEAAGATAPAPKVKLVGTQVPVETSNRLGELATRNGRSKASELRIAIDRHLLAEVA